MSLIYRALWRDDHLDDACDMAAACFTEWVAGKWPALKVPVSGEACGNAVRNGTDVQLDVRTVAAPVVEGSVGKAYRADLIETYAQGARWHTALRSWLNRDALGGQPAQWLWVDVEVVGDVDVNRLGVAAPKLVRDLLDRGVSPSVDGDILVPQRAILEGPAAGEWLAEVILRPGRSLPVIVANDCPTARATAVQHGLDYLDMVEKIRRRTAGMAATYVIDNAAADALINALGRSYGVWDGAIRIYLSGADPTIDNAWRHRYFTSSRYARKTFVAGKAIANHLGPVSAVRKPPDNYRDIKRLLERAETGGSTDELLEMADNQLRESEAIITDLRTQVALQDEVLDALALDLAIVGEERALALRKVEDLESHVRSLLGQLNTPDNFYTHRATQGEQPPAVVDSMSDALDMAKTYLSDRLIIPDEAIHDLEDLETCPMSTAWAQTSWEGLLALHAYAVDRAAGWDGGGFWEWCDHSKNPRAWRATDKKLALPDRECVGGRG